MKTLVWFRNDLRVADNPALYRATELNQPIIACYLLCQEFLERHHVAASRLDFIRRNLQLLTKQLADLEIELKLIAVARAQDVPAEILSLMQHQQCNTLHFNAEYPFDELQRDTAVADLCREQHITVKRFHDRVIIPPGMIRNGQGEPYKVFTAFKRKWLSMAAELRLQPLPKPKVDSDNRIKNILTIDIKTTLQQIDELFDEHTLSDLSQFWPAGEDEAHARLSHFIDHSIDLYQEQRDFPELEGTSKLSPYLALGIISPRQCLASVLVLTCGEWAGTNRGATTWISELIWRDFYQHVVVDFPIVCKEQAMRPQTELFPWRNDSELFTRWCEGKTGFPLVDAAMRQLIETGWMHNRLRMVVAMFLTKNLQIDWRLGEVYFMQMLIDGDFAANNSGWQWSASTGTDSVPYFRIFNPVSQSQRFDPNGKFIRKYVPELVGVTDKNIHFPPSSCGYYAPMVDLVNSRRHTIELFKNLGAR